MVSERKIVVPEGMLRAAENVSLFALEPKLIEKIVEAALRWLSENPIVPNRAQIDVIQNEDNKLHNVSHFSIVNACVEWQRHMFLALEPEPKVHHIRTTAGNTFKFTVADGMVASVTLLTPYQSLDPEAPVPGELYPRATEPLGVDDLLFEKASGIPVILDDSCVRVTESVNDKIKEAYRRGQRSK